MGVLWRAVLRRRRGGAVGLDAFVKVQHGARKRAARWYSFGPATWYGSRLDGLSERPAMAAGMAPGAVPIRAEIIGDPNSEFLSAYGIGAEGVVLVRPDGHVAWRRREGCAEAERELAQVLARVCCAEPSAEKG